MRWLAVRALRLSPLSSVSWVPLSRCCDVAARGSGAPSPGLLTPGRFRPLMTARDGFRNHGRAAGLTFHFRRRWRAIADNCRQLRAPLARRRAGEHQPAATARRFWRASILRRHRLSTSGFAEYSNAETGMQGVGGPPSRRWQPPPPPRPRPHSPRPQHPTRHARSLLSGRAYRHSGNSRSPESLVDSALDQLKTQRLWIPYRRKI